MQLKPKTRLFEDTHPEAERVLIEGLRKMTVAEKLARVQALNDRAEGLQVFDIRRRHPNVTERELQLRLASRRLPPEIMRRVFGWDPKVEGY